MHSNARSFQRARFEVWIVWKFGFELDFSSKATTIREGELKLTCFSLGIGESESAQQYDVSFRKKSLIDFGQF